MVGLVACSPPVEEAVIGRWRQVLTTTNAAPAAATQTTNPAAPIFDFRPNGILVTRGQPSPDLVIPGMSERPMTNRYSFMDEQTLRILFGRGRLEERTVTMQFAFSGNRLILTETHQENARDLSAARARTNAALRAKTNQVRVLTNAPKFMNWGGQRGVLTLERID